ncbi:MAG TPA: pseudouridine-5'-phosphate glycosidase [Propylenella sp.]
MHRPTGHALIETSPEVAEALAAGRPVVALESAIVTHGMPRPRNVETALAVEAIVRENAATPATVALLDGRIRVGLDRGELERLGAAPGVLKASRRDLAPALARKATAGTTVAATMAVAARAGIAVFATGGIGGVHRGAAESFDVSADLSELAATPVAVVCAGCKSILDIPRTLELLETLGVPVLGYGTDEFPAFFARSSGHRLDHRADTPGEVAEVIRLHRQLQLPSGVLVANPIPEADALPAAEIEARIAAACREAEAAGISQKALTPYLLDRIGALTGGRSLAANIALVKNNAALAARVAVELSRNPPEEHRP